MQLSTGFFLAFRLGFCFCKFDLINCKQQLQLQLQCKQDNQRGAGVVSRGVAQPEEWLQQQVQLQQQQHQLSVIVLKFV